ncbi:sporulation integral membrane protein YtvI [Terrisporobacter glycolicus]|uniref:Sodium-lithium/proton antiporter n=1 Tax=Terrisporobacter glycolicus ATCC 14880 = DSM 1288 TaxID=1121315 RepID=A0ABZ2EYM6_9FIRM
MCVSVLNRSFLYKLKNNVIFFVIYLLLFLLVVKTFGYIAPFFIAGLLAVIINPISEKLKRKFKVNKGISTLFLSLLGVGLVIFLASFLLVKGSQQLVSFLNNIDSNSYSYLGTMINDWVSNLDKYVNYFQGISNNSIDIQSLVANYGKNLADIAKTMLAKIIDLATSLPTVVLIIITLFMSTYFIAKDFDKIENSFLNIFTDDTKVKVRRVKNEIMSSIKGYIKAYTILMSITFLVIWISFSIFKIPYGLPLAIIGALLDLIPFLGIIVIFVPVIIYYFVIENYFISIGIAIVFIGLSILRQILEPKLVSVNVGISPLLTIIAIFVGIQVAGILGIIFFLGLLVMHDILEKVDIL